MTYKPTHLKLWTRPDNYAGAVWPDYYSAGFGRSRDSDELEESNFHTALKRLGGESESVLVVREGHWAVGWVEWIAIHKGNTAALKIADALREDYENYPVLDEEDFSNRESESADWIWREAYSVSERIKYIREHPSQFEFRSRREVLDVVRGKYFNGYASELIS